jgi:flagellar motor component MotA
VNKSAIWLDYSGIHRLPVLIGMVLRWLALMAKSQIIPHWVNWANETHESGMLFLTEAPVSNIVYVCDVCRVMVDSVEKLETHRKPIFSQISLNSKVRFKYCE